MVSKSSYPAQRDVPPCRRRMCWDSARDIIDTFTFDWIPSHSPTEHKLNHLSLIDPSTCIRYCADQHYACQVENPKYGSYKFLLFLLYAPPPNIHSTEISYPNYPDPINTLEVLPAKMGCRIIRILCPCLKHYEKQDSSQSQFPPQEQSSSGQGRENCGSPNKQNKSPNVDQPPDLWQTAYNDLDERSRSKIKSFREAGKNDHMSGTTGIVENVIAHARVPTIRGPGAWSHHQSGPWKEVWYLR